MNNSFHGTVNGNLIRLKSPVGLPDGTEVEIVLRCRSLSDQEKRMKLEALFGSCRDDAFLQANALQRRLPRSGASGAEE